MTMSRLYVYISLIIVFYRCNSVSAGFDLFPFRSNNLPSSQGGFVDEIPPGWENADLTQPVPNGNALIQGESRGGGFASQPSSNGNGLIQGEGRGGFANQPSSNGNGLIQGESRGGFANLPSSNGNGLIQGEGKAGGFAVQDGGRFSKGNATNQTEQENNGMSGIGSQPLPIQNVAVSEEDRRIGVLVSSPWLISCAGRCGGISSLPCACHAQCHVYNNCCHDFAAQCPLNAREADNLLRSVGQPPKVQCLKTKEYSDHSGPIVTSGRFVVSSCPKTKMPDIRSFENVINDNPADIVFGIKLDSGVVDPLDEKATTPTNTPASLSTDYSPGYFNTLVDNIPITDLVTGISYVNRAIFECHLGAENNPAVDWRLLTSLAHNVSRPDTHLISNDLRFFFKI